MSVSKLCLPLLGLSALPLDTLIDLVQPRDSSSSCIRVSVCWQPLRSLDMLQEEARCCCKQLFLP